MTDLGLRCCPIQARGLQRYFQRALIRTNTVHRLRSIFAAIRRGVITTIIDDPVSFVTRSPVWIVAKGDPNGQLPGF